ncbi:MAG: GWxTD domain-containing protein [Candidatus Stahlbacteria bacterium]|nr:MAG: GWxTD domain-containing protein [Candidatus Stahlbacteria bacterium]
MILLFFGLGLIIDIAQFYQNPTTTNCEIYYSMPIKELKFKEVGGKLTAEFPIVLKIRDEITNELYKEELQKIVNVSYPKAEIEFSDVQQVVLSSGRKYNISIEVLNNKGEILKAETTIVSREWGEGLTLSDIQISHTLLNTFEESRFVKNSYKLIPFPRRNFDKNRYLLASYCELYGLEVDSILITYIIGGRGNGEDTIFNEYYGVISDRMAIPMIFNVLGYPQGIYTLKLIAQSETLFTTSSKKFAIKEIEEITKATIPDSIIDYASFINYIASPRKISELNSLPPQGKILFLLKFWGRRDPDASTKENEALNEFVRRVKYADENFTRGIKGRRGRFADIGRIYIKFGPPDDIIRRSSEIEVHPYIIWHYFDTDDWFIFMDKGISGEYELIYSSIKVEPTDPSWRMLILPEDRSRILGSDF